MKKDRFICWIGMILLLSSSAGADTENYDEWDLPYTTQGLLGAVRFDNLKFNIADSATPAETDFSTLPQLGGAWSTLPLGNRFQVGLETSLLFGFQVDKVNYIQAGGGELRISLSTSLWMFDLAGGGYASLYLDSNKKVRVYAGGGPLFMYVSYRTDKKYSDGSTNDVHTTSASGIGTYARTGIEFRVYEKGMFGLGVRGSWAGVDFSNAGGHSDLTGIAAFATFTAGF